MTDFPDTLEEDHSVDGYSDEDSERRVQEDQGTPQSMVGQNDYPAGARLKDAEQEETHLIGSTNVLDRQACYRCRNSRPDRLKYNL
jgi:hypothetical protein